MSAVSELIKAAHTTGEPLFKGDMGHPFYGNQYVTAELSAQAASNVAHRTDKEVDHAKAARLHWAAARMSPSKEGTQIHSTLARTHDERANKIGAMR